MNTGPVSARTLFAFALVFWLLQACSSPSSSPDVSAADVASPKDRVVGDVAEPDEVSAPTDVVTPTDLPFEIPDLSAELAETDVVQPFDTSTFDGSDSLDVLPDETAVEMVEDEDVAAAPGLGTVTGSCGDLAALLEAGQPDFVTNSYVFDAEVFDPARLVAGAQKRYELDNVGGSSLCSEVMSIQLLAQCEDAVLYKTESEIDYDTAGDMADFVTDLGELRVGVSVTRAYKGPFVDTYTVADAEELLTKKLAGLDGATGNVSAADAWDVKLLHVWTLKPEWVPVVQEAYDGLSPQVKSDIVVMMTVEENSTWVVPEDCKPE